MKKENCWISFYEWKNSTKAQNVQMMAFGKEVENPKHKWKSVDGQQLESSSTFPAFKSLLLEEEEKHSKAIPLVLAKEEPQMSYVDKRIQYVLEQIN